MTDNDHTIIPAQDTTDVKLPTIQEGDSNAFVTVLQAMLLNRGYSLSDKGADGVFGKETTTAVMRFQRDWGLKEDGIVNSQTWMYLETSPEMASTYTVTIPGISKEMAEDLMRKYVGHMTPDL